VLIKLADRLHNMRTLYGLPSEKQQRIARQTMEIYAPLAERLGIWQMKWELEDLAFKALEPERFRELAKLLDTRRKGRESYIDRAIADLTPKLEAAGIDADLQGRPKHIYSIWKKMERKSAEFGEIYDVYAIRILVDDVRDCYAALGIVHSLWRPIPGQFDDYIAVPKNNLYQSLHTAVIALDGKPLEIQIRTQAMHQVSEVGIAAHWRYKEGTKSDREYDAKLAWLRQLLDWQRDVSDATEFVEGIKLDIFQDQVFVFTPKGDIKDLPAGATPLDFAYRIHTDVGHRTIGSKVNNRLVPLDYRLKNGDIVEVVTTKGEHGPSRDWMNVVKTSHAREKIRQWFKRKDRDENIVHGRDSLERELRRLARTSIAVVGPDQIAEVGKHYNYETLDDFYAAIGYGAVSSQTVVMRLGVVDDVQGTLPTVAPPQPKERTGGVRVKGVGDLLVRFGKCCHPIPGDPIVGFITRGKGVTVHLQNCTTVVNEREVSRLIDVEWESAPTETYPIAIRVEAYDRTGLLSDITQVVAENKVNIVAAHVGVTPDHTAVVTATIQVHSVSQLARVMGRIETLKDVISVQRDTG
jgi:GTP pyrophosphokinase